MIGFALLCAGRKRDCASPLRCAAAVQRETRARAQWLSSLPPASTRAVCGAGSAASDRPPDRAGFGRFDVRRRPASTRSAADRARGVCRPLVRRCARLLCARRRRPHRRLERNRLCDADAVHAKRRAVRHRLGCARRALIALHARTRERRGASSLFSWRWRCAMLCSRLFCADCGSGDSCRCKAAKCSTTATSALYSAGEVSGITIGAALLALLVCGVIPGCIAYQFAESDRECRVGRRTSACSARLTRIRWLGSLADSSQGYVGVGVLLYVVPVSRAQADERLPQRRAMRCAVHRVLRLVELVRGAWRVARARARAPTRAPSSALPRQLRLALR